MLSVSWSVSVSVTATWTVSTARVPTRLGVSEARREGGFSVRVGRRRLPLPRPSGERLGFGRTAIYVKCGELSNTAAPHILYRTLYTVL